MRYTYFTCDVFTQSRFGGNPLAVFPQAEGLSDEQMQRIAREFNFSETTFVFPAEADATRKVRIFTPGAEVPFAGHPNVGTAFVLAQAGELGDPGAAGEIRFEEMAGIVPISLTYRGASLWCELAAPETLSVGREVPVAVIAATLSLPGEAFQIGHHLPREASVGLPFVFAQVKGVSNLAQAKINLTALEALDAEGFRPEIFVYTRTEGDHDIQGRMFAPFCGVPEDPATGSAACALAGLLADLDSRAEGELKWRIAQGIEMGRPSLLEATAIKRAGAIVETRVGGGCILMSEGTFYLD